MNEAIFFLDEHTQGQKNIRHEDKRGGSGIL